MPHTGILAFLYVLFVVKSKDEDDEQDISTEKPSDEKPTHKPTPKTKTVKPDPFKEKGDLYEKFIGQAFEKKGELVIYNGFIYGYDDKGVDIISISLKTKIATFTL